MLAIKLDIESIMIIITACFALGAIIGIAISPVVLAVLAFQGKKLDDCLTLSWLTMIGFMIWPVLLVGVVIFASARKLGQIYKSKFVQDG